MNLPSLPSEVLTLTYPSWQPFITPPWSSKPHHPTMTTLPPIQRQHHYRDTARESSILSSLSSFSSPDSASSCHHPSSHPRSCSSSLGRIARFLALGLGTEASDASSRQRTF
jgi:hypothetical protein